MTEPDNGQKLRDLIEAAGVTQARALELFNRRQARKLSLRALKTYLAHSDSKTRVVCTDEVLRRIQKVLDKVQSCT